jgi:hypothetical protein
MFIGKLWERAGQSPNGPRVQALVQNGNCTVTRAYLICWVCRLQYGIVDQCRGHRACSYLDLKIHACLRATLHVETGNTYGMQGSCAATQVCKIELCDNIVTIAAFGLIRDYNAPNWVIRVCFC